MNLEKLSKELSNIGNIDGWDKMVKRVALMVLEAQKADLEWSLDPNQDGTIFGDPYEILKDRIANITAEITKLKDR